MCLSAEADLAVGVAVMAIGVDACRHLRGRHEYLFVAGLPVALGLHQIVEAFVWWGLEGDVPARVGEVAMWIYLMFAFVALPVLAPALVLRIEPSRERRRRLVAFVVLGGVVAAWLLMTMLRTAPVAETGDFHIVYDLGFQEGVIVVALYVLATCGSMLVSGLRHVVWFGLANLVAIVVLARLSADGFASLWCFYAAVASAAIAAYMRIGERGPEGDLVGSRRPERAPTARS